MNSALCRECSDFRSPSDILVELLLIRLSIGVFIYFIPLETYSPPFTAYNQEELAEKINEGRFRRIPYRYSNELNTLLCRMLHLKVCLDLRYEINQTLICLVLRAVSHSVWLRCQDYLRPSVDSILQSSLISTYVAQEQKKAQGRQQRGSCDLEQPKLVELKLKEQALRQREQDLKEREERLERKDVLIILNHAIVSSSPLYFTAMIFHSACQGLLWENCTWFTSVYLLCAVSLCVGMAASSGPFSCDVFGN